MTIATPQKIKSLLNKGYKPYRKRFNQKTRSFILQPQTSINLFYLKANFNTQLPGGTAIFLIKGNRQYYFGLHKPNQPPVLTTNH